MDQLSITAKFRKQRNGLRNYLLIKDYRAEGIAQWQHICSACVRPSCLVPQHYKNK
jgi:hypothetical protein